MTLKIESPRVQTNAQVSTEISDNTVLDTGFSGDRSMDLQVAPEVSEYMQALNHEEYLSVEEVLEQVYQERMQEMSQFVNQQLANTPVADFLSTQGAGLDRVAEWLVENDRDATNENLQEAVQDQIATIVGSNLGESFWKMAENLGLDSLEQWPALISQEVVQSALTTQPEPTSAQDLRDSLELSAKDLHDFYVSVGLKDRRQSEGASENFSSAA